MDMKRFFLYAIVIAALALAGCGGNGGGGMAMPEDCPAGEQRNTAGDCVPIQPPTPTEDATAAAIATAIGADDAARPTIVTPTLTSAAGEATVSITDANGDLTPTGSVVPFMEGDSPPTIDGWQGSTHSRTVNNVVETVTVYNDVDPLGPEAWLTWYDGTSRPGTGTSDADNTTGLVTLVTSDDSGTTDVNELEVLLNLIDVPAFPTGDRQTFAFAEDEETPGMFNDTSGMFTCAQAGGCEVITDMDGEITAIRGEWNFTPTIGMDQTIADIEVQGVIPDGDYLQFGYWLVATEGDDETTYGIATFFDGADAFTVANVAALEGSATYTGKATGMFVTTSGTGDNKISTGSGQFTADATLTANFSMTDDIADEDAFSISGTVDNFSSASADDINGNWSVSLGQARFSTPTRGTVDPNTGVAPITAHAAHTNVFDGTTTGGGTWNGGFFGNPTGGAETDPTGVAGEFTAGFDDGNVIGAFGATR
ncbi:MAG: hypothetical protein J4F35_18690 [Candidatus Latescibacteria bacterium]|nr:hypothetical protein [Candidatus Latescibacterota bacterium]